jgi:hypothetical protein
MAHNEYGEYIKWGLWAVGAYLAYEYVWPMVTSGLTNIESSVSGMFSPQTTTISTGNTQSTVTTNTLSTSPYISAQDKANISLLTPVNTIGLTFSQWNTYYQQAKGFSSGLNAASVGIGDSDQINLDQYTLLVNAKFPNPTIAGLGYIGLQRNNGWYGVI